MNKMILKLENYMTQAHIMKRMKGRSLMQTSPLTTDQDNQSDHPGQCDEWSSDSFVSRRPCARLQVSELGDSSGRHTKSATTRQNQQQQARSRRTPSNWSSSSLALLILIANSADFLPVVEGVDCFKCSSRNGSNPLCEDPFHNTNTTRVTTPILPEPHPNVIYHTPCYAGKKGRDGLFPASACIKLTGIFDKTGETLVVRHCALDSGSLTQDTELARMSHCGKFQFEGDLLRGCVLACPEDACNSASSLTRMLQSKNGPLPLIMWLLSMFLSLCLIHHRL